MRYTSNLGSVNESQGPPQARGPPGSYVINLPHQKHPQYAEYQEPRMQQRQRAYSTSTAADVDGADSHARHSSTSSPAAPTRHYKVPNNTPAKFHTAPQNVGQTSPRFVVQLPASLLNQKRPNLAGSVDESNEKGDSEVASEAGGGAQVAIPAPKFHMPPPSLFKAAPTRAPLVIRPPPGQAPRTESLIPAHKEDTEMQMQSPELELHTPELTEDALHEEQSPTTTLGAGTPATISGQFTPAMSDSTTASIAGFSPEIKAGKMLPTIELPHVHGHGQGKDASGAVTVEQERVQLQLQPPVRIIEDEIL